MGRILRTYDTNAQEVSEEARWSNEVFLRGTVNWCYDVEAIINSRPLTYLTTDDPDQPVTPSHLISGIRLLNVPEHLYYNEDDSFQILRDWS